MVEIDEHPESQWCAHGEEWVWDGEHQHYISPHGGEPADAGAFPEDCNPTRASYEAWLDARDRGVVR